MGIYERLTNGIWRTGSFFRGINKLFGYSEQEIQIKTCMEFISGNKIKGDYLEFGVFEGKNFAKAFHFAENLGINDMRFFAFDSFEGLPKLEGKDVNHKQFFEGQYDCSYNKFERLMFKKNVDMERVIPIRGWFDRVLDDRIKKEHDLKKAAYVFIDCNLYESTISVLEFITDLIQDGTIIVFDDYYCAEGSPKQGERKAFEDWLKNNNFIATQYRKYYWHGESFILHKNEM